MTAKVTGAARTTTLGMRSGNTNGAVPVTLPASDKFVRYGILLKCFERKGVDMSKVTAPFALTVEGPADVSLTEVRLGSDAEVLLPCP